MARKHPRRRYQLPWWRHALWIGLIACICAYPAVRITAALIGGDPSLSAPGLAAVVAAALWLAVLVLLRLAFAGAYVTGDGVRIVGPVWSRRLRWNEIREFKFQRWGPFPDALAVCEPISGDPVPIYAIQRPNPLSEGQGGSVADELVDELNDRLADARSRNR